MKRKPSNRLPGGDYFTLVIPKWSLYLVGVALLIIGIWIGISMEENGKPRQPNTASPVFAIATMDVAKKFACSCGSCSERNLATCDCPTAVSTKQFIETNLSAGLDEDEVINIVKRVYGHFRGG